MSCNDFEEEILTINALFNEVINKLDMCNKRNQYLLLDKKNIKLKENIDELISMFNISKDFFDNTLHEIRFNNCLDNLHNYIDDFIDIHPELSQKITYCKHCGVLKK